MGTGDALPKCASFPNAPLLRALSKCALVLASPHAARSEGWSLPAPQAPWRAPCPVLGHPSTHPAAPRHASRDELRPGSHPTWSNSSPLPGSSGFNQEPTQQHIGQQDASTPLSPNRLLPTPLTREDQSPEPNGTQKLLHKLGLGLGTAASALTRGSEATGQRQDPCKHLEVAGPVTGPPAPPRDPGHSVPSGMAQQHQSCTASSSHKEFVFSFPLCVFLLHPSVLRSRRCPPGRAACPAHPQGTKPEMKPTHASSGSNTPKKRLFAPNCL